MVLLNIFVVALGSKTFLDHRSAGFLVYLSSDVEGNANRYILFDIKEYDYGNNYNPATGIYTIPYDGMYLVHARVYGRDKDATHFITVDGTAVTYTKGYDPGNIYQFASTSIVLHLLSGQEVAVEPTFSETIDGSTS